MDAGDDYRSYEELRVSAAVTPDHHIPPPAVQDAARRWDVRLLERTHTRYSQTWFAMRGEQHVVLKVGDAPARQREATCLRAYARNGSFAPTGVTPEADESPACLVLAEADGALLLERVLLGDDLRPLALHDDDAATAIAGEVYTRMHRAVAGVPRPTELPDLAAIAAAFKTYWERPDSHLSGLERLPKDLVARAESMLVELTAPSTADCVVHGDAHHQNLLRQGFGGPADTWRVIDPHGWWGDPTFDAVALMLNLHGSLDLAARPLADLRRLAHRRAAILAETAAMDSQRLLAWTLVGGVIAELWCLADHGFVQGGPLKLAQALADSGSPDAGRVSG